MKLLVAGSTGLVGTEVIRQALSNPAITSIVAIARRPVPAPANAGPNADPTKLKTVVLEDFTVYTDDAKQQMAGADACIWTLAITPTKSKNFEKDHVRTVCRDYTLAGLRAMHAAHNAASPTPFRFVYTSGAATQRDQTAAPIAVLGDYALMRGDVENELHAYAAAHSDVRVAVAKPGMIDGPGRGSIVSAALKTAAAASMGALPVVHLSEIAAVMIARAVDGIEGAEVEISNRELVEAGRALLKKEDYVR